MEEQGYKYVVQTFHGYSCKLNSGEIYAGYQNKENLNTKAWDPKNIEMQFRVQGDSRACVAFAIDIQNREVIIINHILDEDRRVISPKGFKTIEKYLQPDYLTDINIDGWKMNPNKDFGIDYLLPSSLINLSATNTLINLEGWTTLNMTKHKNMTPDSWVEFFTALPNITSTQTINLGSEILSKLTSDQIAIATNKGWSVV